MKELIGHIETLLLTNDCVIVPDFGGFIAFNVSAKWVEDGTFFVPPLRTVGFNPQLKLNDGLVVQAYMGACGTTFPDASKRVKKAARELKNTLMIDGKIELKGLGTLRVALDGSHHFIPFIDGLNSPTLYGLGELHIIPLSAEALAKKTTYIPSAADHETQSVNEERKFELPEEEPRPEYELTGEELHEEPVSRHRFLRMAVASAAAVAFFLLLSVPVKNVGPEAYQAKLVSTGWLDGKAAVKQTSSHAEEAKAASAVTSESESVTCNETLQPTDEIQAISALPVLSGQNEVSADTYFIIVGALSQKESAVSMVAQLRETGYNKALLMSGPKVHKVSITSFSDEEEAVKALRKFRAGKYEDAWMFKKKI